MYKLKISKKKLIELAKNLPEEEIEIGTNSKFMEIMGIHSPNSMEKLINELFDEVEEKVLRYCDYTKYCTECKFDKELMNVLRVKYIEKSGQFNASTNPTQNRREQIILEAKKILEAHSLPVPDDIDNLNFETINGALNGFIQQSIKDNRIDNVKAYFLVYAYFYKYYSPEKRWIV